MAGTSLTVTDWMEPSVIWRSISSALMLAKLPILLSYLTNHPPFSTVCFFLCSSRPPTPLLVPVIFMTLSASLSLSYTPSFVAAKWVWWLDPVPREDSYLDVFTICSPSNSESLAEDQQQRNATSYCFLILIYSSCSYRFRVHVWHSWWLHCVHCVVSSGNSGDGRMVLLTFGGKEKKLTF